MSAPLFVPIDWAAICTVLRDWHDTVSGCETIWEGDGGPQPAYPYASLNILPGQGDLGAPDELRTDGDGNLIVVGRRDFFLSCQIHVGGTDAKNPNCNARARADAVVASLSLPPFQQMLSEVNLGVWGRGHPQMLDLEVGTVWIRRSQVDIRFATTSLVDTSVWPDLAQVGWFNKVVMSSNLSPLQGGGGLNWTDEILDPNAP